MRDDQIERYARHVLLVPVGGVGQRRLFDARVAIVGDCPGAQTAAKYLCAGGVGTLKLDPAAAMSWRDDLGALNTDCAIVSEGDVDLTLAPTGGRMAGAMAAQRAMVTLSGAAGADVFTRWTTERGGFTWR